MTEYEAKRAKEAFWWNLTEASVMIGGPILAAIAGIAFALFYG